MWTVRESMKELFGVFRKINCKQGPFSNFLVVETTVQCFLNIVFCHIPAHLMELSRCFVPIIWDNVGVGDRRKRLSRSFAPKSRQEPASVAYEPRPSPCVARLKNSQTSGSLFH